MQFISWSHVVIIEPCRGDKSKKQVDVLLCHMKVGSSKECKPLILVNRSNNLEWLGYRASLCERERPAGMSGERGTNEPMTNIYWWMNDWEWARQSIRSRWAINLSWSSMVRINTGCWATFGEGKRHGRMLGVWTLNYEISTNKLWFEHDKMMAWYIDVAVMWWWHGSDLAVMWWWCDNDMAMAWWWHGSDMAWSVSNKFIWISGGWVVPRKRRSNH